MVDEEKMISKDGLVVCFVCGSKPAIWYNENNELYEIYCPMTKIYPPHKVKVFDYTLNNASIKWNKQFYLK